jgi:hypothetical protein
MTYLSRCRSCRTVVKLTAQDANNTQMCCDNPYYVKVKPIHFMHKEAPGEPYTGSIKVGGFMAKVLEAEGVINKPLRLACSEQAQRAGVAATAMTIAVTCPDCLDWMESNSLPEDDISIPPDLPQEIGSLSEVRR